MKRYYLLLDTETSNLNFDENGKSLLNLLLELSYILVDENFKELKSKTYLIENDIVQVKKNMEPRNHYMHNKNGLLKAIEKKDGMTPLKEVDIEIAKMLNEYIWRDCEIILTGNNIQFDYEIIRRCMPRLYSKLHFKLFDVSSLQFIISDKYKKKYNHRAEDDVRETYNEIIHDKNLVGDLYDFHND